MASLSKQGKSSPLSVEHPLKNPFIDLHHEVSKAMNEFYHLFEPVNFHFGQFENVKLSPSMDIVEDNDNFKVEVEMPGMDEKDIKLSIDENRLTIYGEKTISKKDEKKNYLSREISYGCYERSIELPPSADIDKACASFKKGMLWVTIPKKAGSQGKARKINIEKA
ncbi:Hsp20/alpha crystallin family protein [Legionella fairfieldensis]|uniref:Hsp20/alpha crystallin family protein n=1 Tax=Legionella fairfieldensis TaxID=45064 RepID=UPI00048DB16A|nr:Hsp20/alpha crystallin family protein [Legionella fairfieldensis]